MDIAILGSESPICFYMLIKFDGIYIFPLSFNVAVYRSQPCAIL